MTFFARMRNACYLLTICFYLLTIVLPNPAWFRPVTSGLAILCLLVSIPVAGTIVKLISAVFLIGGGMLLFSHGTSLSASYLLFGKMLDLLTLFSLVPFMAIPIQVGRYSPAILHLIARFARNERKLHRSVTLIAYGLASIMNLAALPMTYYSIQPALEKYEISNGDRFLSTSITRGYAMPLVWSPVAAVVGAVVQVTHASWSWILPFSLLLSVIGLLLGFVLSPKPSLASAEMSSARLLPTMEDHQTKPKAPNPLFKIGQMALGILLFAVLMTVLQQWATLSIVSAVTILCLPFSAGWSLLLKQQKEFLTLAKKQFSTLAKMQDQFAVFLSAGFFVNVLAVSGVAPAIDHFLVQFSRQVGTEWFLILLPLIPVLLSLVGMHPVVSIALLGESLNPAILGIRPEWVAVAFLGGGVTTFLLSPFNATLTVMGGVLKRSPFELAKWNLPFCSLYLVFVMILAALLHHFLP